MEKSTEAPSAPLILQERSLRVEQAAAVDQRFVEEFVRIISNQRFFALAACLLFATCAMATTITGKFDLTGSAGVSGTTIDFFNGPPSCSTGPNIGIAGCFLVGGTTPGSSFDLESGTIGLINDLQGGPIVGPTSILGFMKFSNGIVFDITNILGSASPVCNTVDATQAGVACTPYPGPSPFTLTNGPGLLPGGKGVAQSVSVQFTIFASGYSGTKVTGSTPYVGIFSTEIAAENAQDILNQLASGTGVISHAYSANFSPLPVTDLGTPEPGTFSLIGLGFGLFGLLPLRRFRKS